MAEPKVCVSLAEPEVDACLAALAELECAEIRLDAMQPTREQVRRLFSGPQTLVATCRAGTHDDDARTRLLLTAIEAGASYVDVELDAPQALRREVFRVARAQGCQLIVSVHDFETTPPRAELLELRAQCFDAGGDVAKLACMVHTPQQAARLLGLLDDAGAVIVVGMGRLGRLVRIVAPLLGSPLSYASLAPGRETAPDQLDRRALERWLQELGGV